jgi:molybdenum cofactor guanylyltransferase
MTLSAVLLVGGESRRMGRDKATIVWRGRPLWQWQLQVLRDLGPAKIFISARSEPSWLPRATELLLDEPPSRGPLSGLTRALARMRTSHLIALAVDMPFMTSEKLRALSSLATIACGVLPMIADRAEPLAAIYPREGRADFLAALENGDLSLQRLSRSLVQSGKLRTFPVSAGEEGLYRSVNAPEDFKEAPFPNRPPNKFGGS